jgi:diguanylate cyclase (GGDEF)-like protein
VNGRSGERWLQQVLDAMTEQIAVLDRHGTILMVNEAWQLFGRENGSSPSTGFGVNYLEVCRRSSIHHGEGSEQARRTLEGLRAVLEGSLAQFHQEYTCHSPTEQRWFALTATPLTASPGGAVVTHVNVTARKLREQEILRQAHQDPLTGLANRRRIEAQAVQMLAHARRGNRSAVVLVIDLDGFKAINDTFGHHVGDLVLRETAARLAAKTRPPGLLGRLGGDEFVALLSGVDAREAEALIETYRSIFSQLLAIDGRELRLGGSIGLAFYPEQGRTFPELLQVADAAMYRVKSASPHRRSGESEAPRSEAPRSQRRGTERRPERGRSRRRGQRPGRRPAPRRHQKRP